MTFPHTLEQISAREGCGRATLNCIEIATCVRWGLEQFGNGLKECELSRLDLQRAAAKNRLPTNGKTPNWIAMSDSTNSRLWQNGAALKVMNCA